MKALTFFVFIIFSSIVIISGCQPSDDRTYNDADIQQIKSNASKLWNSGDVALVDSLYSADCLYHSADFLEAKGTVQIANFIKGVYTSYSDFAVMLDEPIQLKDGLLFTFKATGTNDGPLIENLPPTGKKMSFNGVSIAKIKNGKIVEEWVYYNQLPLYKQLGYKLVLAEEKPVMKKE